jgi:periplasmic protein TonB
MFADSLRESRWGSHSHRGWIILASFAVQTLAVATLLALPLLHTEGLPQMRSVVEPMFSSPRPAVTSEIRHLTNRPSNSARSVLVVPRQTSRQTKFISAESSQPPVDVNRLGIPGGTSNLWTENPIINSIANSSSNFALPPTPLRQPPRISRMMEGNLIHRVQPVYPTLARQARIQGQVVLRAIIKRDGMIENLQILNGHPMLVQAAIDAVKQWRYRPYFLNGEPVEVETQVTVNFVLSGS